MSRKVRLEANGHTAAAAKYRPSQRERQGTQGGLSGVTSGGRLIAMIRKVADGLTVATHHPETGSKDTRVRRRQRHGSTKLPFEKFRAKLT